MASSSDYKELMNHLKSEMSRDGCLTLREKDIREILGLKRLRKARAEEITVDLRRNGIEIYPPLSGSQDNPVRVYAEGSRAWRILQEVLHPIGLYEDSLLPG